VRDRFKERFGASVGDDGVEYKRMIDNGGTLHGDTVTRPMIGEGGQRGQTIDDPGEPFPHG